MPKRRGRKKKGSDAWTNILRVHKRGPKRVRVSRPRRRNNIDPLTLPEHSKRIQIALKDNAFKSNFVGIVVFNQAFTDMGLVQDETYTMSKNKLTRAGHALQKCIELFGHNDFILGRIRELKLDNCVGRCIVMTGKINSPDVVLNIMPEKRKPSKHVIDMFKKNTTYKREVEYM